MSLYWNDFYNQGTGLFGSQVGTGDITCGNIFCDYAINQIASATLLIGDTTLTTKLGKTGNGTTYINGNVILTSSNTQNGFLRAVNGLIEANNTLSNIVISNPNIASNINMRGYDIYNAGNVYANNINDIISNIGNLQANGNSYVLKTGDTMTGDLNIQGAVLNIKYNNVPSNYGGYFQLNPNVSGVSKLYQSGDRRLDIDGQTSTQQCQFTGWANVQMANPLIAQSSATFNGATSHYSTLAVRNGSTNYRLVGFGGDQYIGSFFGNSIAVQSDGVYNKTYDVGASYPFIKMRSYQPFECDTINAVGATLNIANDDSTDTVQIGVGSNIHIINIGTGGLDERDTINIGSGNTIINMFGNTIYNQITNHRVADRDLVLNANAIGSGTSGGCGLWIRDNNEDASNYFLLSTDRDGYDFKAIADPLNGGFHLITLKNANISQSQGRFLVCQDDSVQTVIKSGSIVKTDLPSSVAFNDQNNNFYGSQQIESSLAIKGNITNSPNFNGYVQFSPNAVAGYNKIYTDGSKILSLDGQTSSYAFEMIGFANVRMTEPLDLVNNKITTTYVPVNGADVVNKTYVDGAFITPANGNNIYARLGSQNTFTQDQTFNCANILANSATTLFINTIRTTSSAVLNIDVNSNLVINSPYVGVQPTAPTVGTHLTNKTYCDLKLPLTGGTLSGSLTCQSSYISAVDNASIAIRRQTTTNSQFITFQDNGGTVSRGVVESAGSAGASACGTVGAYDFNIGSYNNGGDTNIFYQGSVGGRKIRVSSNITAFSDLFMNNNKIVGLATPTSGTDATNKTYVDNQVATSAILGSNNTFTGENTFQANVSITTNKRFNVGTTGGTIILYGGNIGSASSANPTSINADGMTISQIPNGSVGAGCYIQSWNSRPLVFNSLGNNIQFGSSGTGISLLHYGTPVFYNAGDTNQYYQITPSTGTIYTSGRSFTQSGQSQGYDYTITGYSNLNLSSPTNSNSLFKYGTGGEAWRMTRASGDGTQYMTMRNNAETSTYLYWGMESSGGTGLFGLGNNAVVYGSTTTNLLGFYSNNKKTLVMDDGRLFDSLNSPIYGKDPYSNTLGQARWRDGVFTGTFDNSKTITNMAYGNDSPISTGTRYTHTVIPDQNWIFSISGTYTGLTAGWYCFKVEWDDEIYMTANEVPFQATSYGSKNFPIYIKYGRLNFNMMILNQSGAGSMAYRLDLLTALDY